MIRYSWVWSISILTLNPYFDNKVRQVLNLIRAGDILDRSKCVVGICFIGICFIFSFISFFFVISSSALD